MKNLISTFITLLFTNLIFGQLPNYVSTNGLKAWYSFSGNANDQSIANNNLTNSGGVTFGVDRFGNTNSAATFDGSGQHFVKANPDIPSGSSDRTISFWYKEETNSETQPVLFSIDGNGTYPCQSTYTSYLNTGLAGYYLMGNCNDKSWGNSRQYNNWNHMVYVMKADTIYLYRNDTLLSNNFSYFHFSPSLNTLVTQFLIGDGYHAGGSSNPFKGAIDDFGIWDRALTRCEISSLNQAQNMPCRSSCIVAQYDFNGNANDISGNANHGAAYGATVTSDRFGNSNSAYSFNGTSDSISFPQTFIFNQVGDASISLWIKNTNLPAGVQGTFLYSSRSNSIANRFNCFFNPVSSSEVAINFDYREINTSIHILNKDTIIKNDWEHVVLTRNSNTYDLYVNGTYINSVTDPAPNIPTSIGWLLGNDPSSTLDFAGMIDDVKLYNCAISTNEIDSIYQAEKSNPQGCLVAQYNLNGNANDVSGNGNHGTIYGCIANTDRFGNVNGSLHFDGVNDYIEVPASASLNLTNTMTFTTWFISHDPFVTGQTLIGRQRTSIDKGINLSFDNISGKIELEDGVNFESATASFGGYHMGKWHMLTATHDGTDTKIYIDGVLKTTEPGAINLPVMTEPFNFGREGGFLLNYLHGDLDDIKIYNCALSAADIDSIFIAESPYAPCGFSIIATPLPPVCHDGNDGTIDLTVTGGQPPYAFYWNNNETTEDLNDLFPGNYSIIINDDNGCDTMITYTVFNPVEMDITLNITNPSCGMNNGNAIATVLNGGTGPFDYQWSSGDTLAIADSLSAGIYMLTVTDPIGCTAAETFGVNNSGGPTLSSIITNASCQGILDGDINLSVSGGTSPFTYSWSDASITQDLTNVAAGSYMVEVTDANGCVAIHNATINASTINLSNVTLNSPTCGNSDGGISVVPSGGTSPYDYQWSSNAGSAITSSVNSLSAGNYYVTVTDDNGCAETEMYALSNSNGPTLVVTSVNSAHCSGNTGAINISISGGVSPFDYEWSNGETTQDISGLSGGDYSVEVTDDDGCVTSLNVNVPGITLDPITLCMSTVNDINGKVLCLWQKPALDYISHFNIYRENSIAGQYDFWFSRPYDSTSQWTDLTANPQIRGWRYKVTYVDTCGNESPFGTNHKTIHAITSAGLSGGVNISWDHYEGFNFPTFYIERYHISTGWITIDSIPSTLHSYFDTTTLTGTLQYAINIEAPSTCDPTRVGVNTSRSNVKNQPMATPNGLIENENQISFNVYPNPAKDEVFISIENMEGGEFELKIFNTIGELILTQKINSSNHKIDTKNLAGGFYSLEVSSNKNTTVKKLVIQK